MAKAKIIVCLLVSALIADLLSIRLVLREWHAFNSDPALTLLMQILPAFILISYLVQIASRKSI